MEKHKHFVKWLLCICLGVFLFQGYLFAGITGKIAGRVLDAETGSPLPGANVIIEGTMMGSASDLEGYYQILNIPPGIYTLKVAMMGYKTLSVENLRVKIDLTTTINADLQATVLETDEAVTVVAQRELVQMDMTGSLSAVGADEITNLPVQEVSDVLELQAGVVTTGEDLHIRGGRAGEVAFWVDGVAATDGYSGSMGVTVENSAIEELQVVSGTFNAEYGQAMSGIINIITKDGDEKYTGQVKAYLGDYVSNNKAFRVLDDVEVTTNPRTGEVDPIADYSNPLSEFNPAYNMEYSLSGPVPLLKDKLTFFSSGRYMFDEGYIYGREWFKPTGVAGDSSLVPMNPYNRMSLQGKLTYRLTSNIKVSYNVFWNKWEKELDYFYTNQDVNVSSSGNINGHAYRYTPYGLPFQTGNGISHIFSINHVLSPSTFYELRINRFENEYERYVYEDPMKIPGYLVEVLADEDAGIEYEVFDPTTSEGAAKLAEIQQQRISFNYIVNPNDADGYVHPDSGNAPVSYSYNKVGMDMTHFNRSTAYWVGKFDLTSQILREHQLKLGAEARFHELKLHSYQLRPKLKEGLSEQIIPFQPWIADESTIYTSVYNQKPKEFSAYIQDKFEYKNLILNIGLRYDYFDANGYVPVDSEDPNIYDPIKEEHIYKNPDAPESERVKYTAEERKDFMYRKVDAKMKVSPRLGIAYPITDKGVIHFSYGHFFQIPNFEFLYSNPGYKVKNGGGNSLFGNPDLEPQKTVMYEIGIQQQLTDDIGIDATLFYRDVRDWVGTSPLISTPISSVRYSLYENKDYENVRGVTLKVEKRHSNHFSARMDYTYQVVEGTYSNPNDAFNAYTNQQEPRLALIPLGWDQTHTLNSSFVYRLNNWTMSLIGRYWTGLPYTPTFTQGTVLVGGSATVGLKQNSARLPSQKSVDLYINRRVELGKVDLQLFLNIYNVFDQINENNVYTDTGSASYSTQIDPSTIAYSADRIGTVPAFVDQPGWYTTPRQIQLGMILGF